MFQLLADAVVLLHVAAQCYKVITDNVLNKTPIIYHILKPPKTENSAQEVIDVTQSQLFRAAVVVVASHIPHSWLQLWL